MLFEDTLLCVFYVDVDNPSNAIWGQIHGNINNNNRNNIAAI